LEAIRVAELVPIETVAPAEAVAAILLLTNHAVEFAVLPG